MLNNIYDEAKSWPFEEARKLEKYIKSKNKIVLFETGYGPSGLPHIGTFGEVVRTSMVCNAFNRLTGINTKLICFSDDMDGLRKIPENIPNQDKIFPFLEFPLTKVPDPFGQFDSFGDHNNAKLCKFLDSFGFKYQFMSSTQCYKNGLFDEMLLKVLHYYKEIMNVMIPTLREERKKTYSPFLPISPKSGRVLQVAIDKYDDKRGTINFRDEDGESVEISVLGGNCKLQWKVDWGMRWAALGIDYEMYGKDLIDSVKCSVQICKILGGTPPIGLAYEHFLDNEGGKISKSKGNGLSVEEWLKYAPEESLSYFMYQNPTRAKRLYFDIIPKCVDEFLDQFKKFFNQNDEDKLDNPIFHIYNGNPPRDIVEISISFSMLLNLASVCNAKDSNILWKYVTKYSQNATSQKLPFLDKLINYAVKYYNDFVEPNKKYRTPTQIEKAALLDLYNVLNNVSPNVESIKKEIYDIGKRHPFSDLKEWFSCMYEVLLGQKEGPRMDSFIILFGIDEMRALIKRL